MNITEALSQIPNKEQAQLIAHSIVNEPQQMQALWEFSISEHKHSWRGTWIMDKIYELNPELIRIYLPQIIEMIPDLKNESKLRQFLKLISLEPLPQDISGLFINRCFDLLLNRSTAPAVSVHAMQILYNFSLMEPDIQNELQTILHELMEESSAGFKCRAKKILKKMKTR